MTKLKLIAAALATLGGLTIGAGLLAQQSGIGDAGRRARAPGLQAAEDSETAAPASRALIEARMATAREIVQSEMQRYEIVVNPTAEDTTVWSRRWMDEELRLRTDPAARLTAIADHLERAKRLEQITDNLARAGRVRHTDALKARYYRLEAEQILSEARSTYGNLPISSPASRGVGEKSGPPLPK